MELWSKIIETSKLPTKLIAWIFIFTGIILLMKDGWLQAIHLQKIKSDFGIYIGLAFLGSGCLLVIEICRFTFQKLQTRRKKKKWELKIIENLMSLDPLEKAILREYFIQSKNTLQLPINDPVIAGLFSKGIINPVSKQGEISGVGLLIPFSLSKDAELFITPPLIGLPEEDKLTDKDIQYIRESRPKFVYAIESRKKRKELFYY